MCLFGRSPGVQAFGTRSIRVLAKCSRPPFSENGNLFYVVHSRPYVKVLPPQPGGRGEKVG